MPPVFELTLALISTIGILFLGLFTYHKNPKSTTNILFFLFSLSFTTYNVFNYLALHQSQDSLTIFWIRLVMANAGVIVLIFLLLTATFPRTKLELNKLTVLLSIILTFPIIGLSLSNLVFSSVIAGTTQPIPGPGIIAFVIHSITYLLTGFIFLIRKHKKTQGREKIQIKFFLTGTIILFASILLTNLFFVIILRTTFFVGLLPIYTLVFVGTISYAIVRHRFLDIGLVVARTVSFTLLIAYVALVYSLLFTFLLSLFPGITVDIKVLTIATILTFITAITFQPISRFLEKITDAIFYKHRYSTSKLLYDLALIMASTLRLEHLTHKLLRELLSQMHIARGAFVLLTEDGGIYEVAHEGYTFTPEFDEKDIKELVDYHDMLIIEELPEGNYKNILRKLDATCVVYLSTEGRYMGLLALGEKLSGDIYTSEDLRLLKIFAPEAAVAIQNAQSYEEVNRFSITLQQEVDKATKELSIANIKLKALDKLKDEFLSLASHELRTPMTAIKSYLWMVLEGRGGKVTEKQKYYLDVAYKSTDRLIALVNDMLNISRIESGKITLIPVHAHLDQLVDDVVVEMTPRSTELGIEISVVSSPTLPEVWVDLDKIKEVLINLVGNSLKFTPRGGKITIKLQKKDNFVETSVSDTGAGIKTEDLPRLFQKFSMIGGNSAQREKNTKGTGLGLYISKLIVELHGGKIWAQSQGIGKGATFTFSLKVFKTQ